MNRKILTELDFFVSKHNNLLKDKQKKLIREGTPKDVSHLLTKFINYIPSEKEINNISLDKTLYEIQQKFDMAKDAKLIYTRHSHSFNG